MVLIDTEGKIRAFYNGVDFGDESDWDVDKVITEFEMKVAKAIGVKYAVGLSSGSSALYLALKCFLDLFLCKKDN